MSDATEPAPRPVPGQLTLVAPRRGKPPRHLADLTVEERREAVAALGHPAFRANQLSTHYFERLVDDPEDMTDLPKAVRDDLVRDLLPPLLTPVRSITRRRAAPPSSRCGGSSTAPSSSRSSCATRTGSRSASPARPAAG